MAKGDLTYAGNRDLARADSMSLDELAQRANECVDRGVQSGLWHVACAGVYLLAAKKQVGHGGWLDWLKDNWRHSPSQAGRYMKIAEQCGRNPSRVADLDATSVRGALALLGAPVEGRANSSRVTNSGPPIVEADYVLRPDPEPANPPVKIDSLDAPVTSLVNEQRQAGATTEPGGMASRVFSGPPKAPTPAPVVPRIVAVCPLWASEVGPLLSEAADSYRKALAKFSEARMRPATLVADVGGVLPGTDESQMKELKRLAREAEDVARKWGRVASDMAEDERRWIRESAARRGGEVA